MLWKKIRRFLIISLSIGLFLLILVMVDLNITRGHVLAEVIDYDSRHVNEMGEQDPNVVYEITPLPNGNYNFRFENNAMTPKYFTGYRPSDLNFDVDASYFFMHAGWTQLVLPDTVVGLCENWGCGTGLGQISINPLEVFELELTYEELIKKSFYQLPFNNLEESITDPIYNEPLLKDSNNFWLQIDPEKSTISITDSIQVHYFIYLESVFDGERYMVKSNAIQLGYLDLLNEWLFYEREGQISFAEPDY